MISQADGTIRLWKNISCSSLFAVANSAVAQLHSVYNYQRTISYGENVGGYARHWSEVLYALANPEFVLDPRSTSVETHVQSTITQIKRGLKIQGGSFADIVLALRNKEVSEILQTNEAIVVKKEEEKVKKKLEKVKKICETERKDWRQAVSRKSLSIDSIARDSFHQLVRKSIDSEIIEEMDEDEIDIRDSGGEECDDDNDDVNDMKIIAAHDSAIVSFSSQGKDLTYEDESILFVERATYPRF